MLQKAKLPSNMSGSLTNEVDGVNNIWYSFFNIIANNFQQLIDTSGCIQLPTFTDTTRPAPGTAGRLMFNTTSGKLNYDNGSAWIAL